MDRFQTFSVLFRRRTGGIGCGEYLSMAQKILLVIGVGSFGVMLGFLCTIQYALIYLIRNPYGGRCLG
jgi:hypothetical protein